MNSIRLFYKVFKFNTKYYMECGRQINLKERYLIKFANANRK